MEFDKIGDAIQYANKSSLIMGGVYHVLTNGKIYWTASEKIRKELYSDRQSVYVTMREK